MKFSTALVISLAGFGLAQPIIQGLRPQEGGMGLKVLHSFSFVLVFVLFYFYFIFFHLSPSKTKKSCRTAI